MQTYLESVDSEWFSQRLVGVLVAIMAAFAIMGIRLLYLQVLQGKELRRLSEINSIRLQDIDAPRGLIQDCNGRTIVENRPSFNLTIVPKDAKPVTQTIQKLARLIDEPVEILMKRITGKKHSGAYTPILLKEDIGRDTLAVVEVHKNSLPGVRVQVAPRRHYIYNSHAAHVVGYMGEISMGELQCAPYEDCKSGDFIGKFG
ncbi:MAG: penicillin-binding protein 2, partial [Desulfatitalea sp.]|nr:penicillin-binding protein 2 [Desulfatitalea sp.]